MEKFASIADFAKVMVKGSFGLYVGTCTEKKMNKFPKGTTPSMRKTTPQNPYLGRVLNITFYQNAATGVNYYTIIKNECKREGIEFTDDEFAAAFPYEECSCGTSVEEKGLKNVLFEKNGQQYLRLYDGRRPTKTAYFMVCDGKIVEEGSALYEDIMRYVSPKEKSAKQEALGIANIVGVKMPKVENVMFLCQGDKMYHNENFPSVDMERIKNLFK